MNPSAASRSGSAFRDSTPGGSLIVGTVEGATEMVAGDYGLVPVGMTHALRNDSDSPVRFAEMQAPRPRNGVRTASPAIGPT
jgi:oxalate decarboxylase/phosphoglucose isomerase-like protein (cupin superfamily)